jgi:CheY-like chemotaxis protein
MPGAAHVSSASVTGFPGRHHRVRRVLLVDDDPTVVALATAVLEPHGYAIRTAHSGEEALALLAREPSDVVVLDVDMPGISGWETLSEIRDNPDLDVVGVVMHSGGALTPPTRDHARPDGLIAKPSSAGALLDAVESARRRPA